MNAYTIYTKKGNTVTSHYNFLADDEYDARQYAFTRKRGKKQMNAYYIQKALKVWNWQDGLYQNRGL